MNYALVGAFVLTLGAMLIAGLMWIASGGAWQKKHDLYLAIENESVAGLNLNAPVKYNGVAVGKVSDIQLDLTNPAKVRLLFAIDRGTPIKTDTLAVLKTQGLTGIAYIELSGGAPGAASLQVQGGEKYPVIRTKPSLTARLEDVLTNVLAKLERTSANIDALLSTENRQAFSSALADLAVVTHTFAARKDTLDAGMASAAKTFENTARVTAQLEPLIARLSNSAIAVEKLGNDAAAASTSAANTVDSVGSDVKRFTAQTLPELQSLMGELSVLSASLRRLSEQTERNPSGLIFGKTPVPDGPGESPHGVRRP